MKFSDPTASGKVKYDQSNPIRLYLIVPILREQRVLAGLIEQMSAIVARFGEVAVLLVTTEREAIEDPVPSVTSAEVISQKLSENHAYGGRIKHIHYPKYNDVVAEQLNYAAEYVEGVETGEAVKYLAVYNADSIIDFDTVQALLERCRHSISVSQQSSLFLWNVPALLRRNRYLLAAFGIYQSCWTLQHEIPRYLLAKAYLPRGLRWVSRGAVVHCVSHGLLIRSDVLQEVGGFLVRRFGGEDLALGFRMRAFGHNIEPVPILENAETPDSYFTLTVQLANWFLGSLGFLVFWRTLPRNVLNTRMCNVISMTVVGCWVWMKWLLRGPVVVLYITLAVIYKELSISLFLLCCYIYIPVVLLLWLWSGLPSKLFPRPGVSALLVSILLYPSVLLLGSIPPFLGLFWAVRIVLGKSFQRLKTERR